MKKVRLLLAAAIMTASMSMTAWAGQWQQDNTGWWFQNDDGSYPTSSWVQIEDKWYYFGETGYMQTGWLDLSSTWYYLNTNGEMQTDSIEIDGYTYNFNEDGSCLNRWASAGDTYIYDPLTASYKNLGAELAERDILDRLSGTLVFDFE